MTQPLTPVVNANAPAAPTTIVAAPAPQLSSSTQFRLSRTGTIISTLLGGWLVRKGWVGSDQSDMVTDWLAALVVGVGGNIVTAQWSTWYRKLLELKPVHAGDSALPLTADDVRQIVQAQLAQQVVKPAPPPTTVTLTPGTIEQVGQHVLTAIGPRLAALEAAVNKGATK